MEKEIIIGIDLGTTNSEVAVSIDNRIEIVEEDGSALLPSVVGLDDDGKLLVGAQAKNQYVLHPERTIKSIKRKMGTDEKIKLGDNEYLPQEISAMILTELKKRAERKLGKPVRKAVITVPAQFSDAQRQATRDAGEIAGLEVVRIINEPTAACLAFQSLDDTKTKNIVAFDLGGGTFDVSVVKSESDVVEVISSHGDNQLGGDDIDVIILDFLIKKINEKEKGIENFSDITNHRLEQIAESAKMHLSDNPYAKIAEDNLDVGIENPIFLKTELERLVFNKMIQDILDKTIDAVHKSLNDAKLKPDDIDEIILVGGSTRSPVISEMLEKEFGKKPRKNVHPDLAVAYGAGVLAARLSGKKDHSVLIDITPHTFGISCIGNLKDGTLNMEFFAPIIEAGMPLPIQKNKAFCTSYDNQEIVEIKIFQGENEIATKNILVGNFQIKGLSKVAQGNELDVKMALDIDGILKVTAVERATGLAKDILIEDALAKISDEKMKEAKEKLKNLIGDTQEIDDAQFVEGGLRNKFDELIKRVENVKEKMDDTDKDDANILIGKIEFALIENKRDNAEKTISELEDLLFYIEE